jgi:hypothetical protein
MSYSPAMRLALVALTLVAAASPAAATEPWAVPETARACPQHGPGFVQLPGSTTCVKIGGRVVAETTTGSRRIARDQIAGFGASGRVSLDARTETPYGPVRSYIRVKAGDGTSRRD